MKAGNWGGFGKSSHEGGSLETVIGWAALVSESYVTCPRVDFPAFSRDNLTLFSPKQRPTENLHSISQRHRRRAISAFGISILPLHAFVHLPQNLFIAHPLLRWPRLDLDSHPLRATMSSSGDVFTYNQYVSARQKQDDRLKREFSNVHTRIDELDDRVDARFNKVDARFDKIDALLQKMDARMDRMDTRMDEMSVDIKRSEALSVNARLRHPFFPIRPIPAYHHGSGLVFPDTYPKDAKTFFSLREPSSDAQKRLLIYLVRFYDIQGYKNWTSNSNTSWDEDEVLEADASSSFDSNKSVSLEDATLRYPKKAVESLAIIFGLDEAYFTPVLDRAAIRARLDSVITVKRPVETQTERRTKLEFRAKETLRALQNHNLKIPTVEEILRDTNEPGQSPSKASDQTRLGWNINTPEKRITLRHPHGTESDPVTPQGVSRKTHSSNQGSSPVQTKSEPKSRKSSARQGPASKASSEDGPGSPTRPFTETPDIHR